MEEKIIQNNDRNIRKIDKEKFTKKDNNLKINKPKVIVICGPTASRKNCFVY